MIEILGLFKSKVSAIDRHFEILDKLRTVKNENALISLCEEDIRLVNDFKREWIKKRTEESEKIKHTSAERRKFVTLPPSYPSFKKLAILYEKQKRYDDAISVCKLAIKAGYEKDGTEGGMKSRIEKLKSKKEQAAKK